MRQNRIAFPFLPHLKFSYDLPPGHCSFSLCLTAALNVYPTFLFYSASPNRRLTALKIPLKDALVMLELMPTPYVTLPVF